MLQGKGILTNLQKEILSLFSQVPDAVQFFLTGDTALSEFYLKHRLSYDLDLFASQDGLIESFSEKLSESLKIKKDLRFKPHADFRLSPSSNWAR